MTNVKLKLMFFLLNALLTVDIVHSRPDSNLTDIIMRVNNSNFTINIPVESNSDTLVVASDETLEDITNNTDIRLEAAINAEREKVLEKHITRKNLTNDTALEKHLNISKSLLDEIIVSETDRDDVLTDLLFKSESEIDEVPIFEFLIAPKINASDVTNKTIHTKSTSISYDDLEQLDRNNSDLLKKVDFVELVEISSSKASGNKSEYNLANVTEVELENDIAPDTILSVFSGFTDVQTLFLACFGTLLPLLAVLFAFLLIRCMCRRWCPQCCSKRSDSSASETSEKNNHQQLKPGSEDGVSTEPAEGDAAPANGSIITMTLKNNHLIVETEERNDITKNGRETKMKYSPDNDGIFVVEVQQSTAYRPTNKPVHNSPPHDPQISTNMALIHRVAEDLESKITEEDSEKSSDKIDKDKALGLSSTGLSISDLSMSSIGSHNVSYSYGSQLGYEQGPFGYPVYAGYDIPKDDIGNGIVTDSSREPLLCKTPTCPDKPVVTAAIFKQDSIIGNDVPGYCMEGCSDGPLLSDVLAREISLQQLQEQMDKHVENGVAVEISERIESPKKTFNRADSLPVRLEDEKIMDAVVDKNCVMETINEDITMDAPSKDLFKGKRGSLPIIRTEMYESVKDMMIPSGSPKFEKFNDDSSVDVDIPPPMITITEECETGKNESAS